MKYFLIVAVVVFGLCGYEAKRVDAQARKLKLSDILTDCKECSTQFPILFINGLKLKGYGHIKGKPGKNTVACEATEDDKLRCMNSRGTVVELEF